MAVLRRRSRNPFGGLLAVVSGTEVCVGAQSARPLKSESEQASARMRLRGEFVLRSVK